MKNIICLLLVVSWGWSAALAQAQVQAPTGVQVPTGSASAANAAQGKDNSAAMASAMMAAAMASQCGPKNVAACIMSALAALQAAQAANSGSGAGESAGANSTLSGVPGHGLGTVTPDSLSGTAGVGDTLASVKSQLAAAGAPVSADGTQMTLPDGTMVPLNSSTSSDSGLSAAGLNQDQIAKARADVAATAASLGLGGARSVAMAPAEGGGGFGGTYGGKSTEKVTSKARVKPNLSGLTKNLGADKIGVSADDIFEMITRRYQSKDASGAFIKN